MTERQIQLIRDSWQKAAQNKDAFGDLFYSHLFETHPEVRQLFKGDRKQQAMKLVSMLATIVRKADNIGEIISDVQALGARHNNYGTQPEHYPVVGGNLIWTLSHFMGDKWTQEHADAWTEVYHKLAAVMIEAAAKAKAKVVSE